NRHVADRLNDHDMRRGFESSCDILIGVISGRLGRDFLVPKVELEIVGEEFERLRLHSLFRPTSQMSHEHMTSDLHGRLRGSCARWLWRLVRLFTFVLNLTKRARLRWQSGQH